MGNTIRRLPIWVRVTGIVALVLAGVLATSMALTAVVAGDQRGSGGGHGSGGTEMHSGSSPGDHAGGDHSSRTDHSGDDHGSGG
jgi:hypothetical protein